VKQMMDRLLNMICILIINLHISIQSPQDDIHLHFDLGDYISEPGSDVNAEQEGNMNSQGLDYSMRSYMGYPSQYYRRNLRTEFGQNNPFVQQNKVQSPGTCSCGKAPKQGNRISGGSEAQANQFPWVVRIVGGCAAGYCGGTLISPRLVLSAYHCTYHPESEDTSKPCDHSDGRRLAVLGQHEFHHEKIASYYTIPIIDVKYPPNQLFRLGTYDSHDFAVLVLSTPAQFSPTIQPICLPQQGQDFSGVTAVAAGWGRYASPDISKSQSTFLRAVSLPVSSKKYKHFNFFGTKTVKIGGIYQDPCSGDSGGPLMYLDPSTQSYMLIGTVQGSGYDCRSGETIEVEGSSNGMWNKVSNHVDFVKKVMTEMGETPCRPG